MKASEIKNILVKHKAGSHSYGTNTKGSDLDIRGIFCADPVQVRTPFFAIKEQKIEGEEDTTLYELANYAKLAADNNPNILETLWVDLSDVIYSTDAYMKLRAGRKWFMSSKIAFTTSGYASSQLLRLQRRKKHANHLPALNQLCEVMFCALDAGDINKRWIRQHCGERVLNYFFEKYAEQLEGEPEGLGYKCDYKNIQDLLADYSINIHNEVLSNFIKPKQTNFVKLVQNFQEEKMLKLDIHRWRANHRFIPFGGDLYGVYSGERVVLYNEMFELNLSQEEHREDGQSPLFVVRFNRKEYKHAKNNYSLFWEWYDNRNATRLEMEKKFGFDAKHAMHLVRLLRIGEEALKTGEYNVKRDDAAELLDIRNGAWPYEKLIAYAEEKEHYINEVLYKKTHLPKSPNKKKIAELIMDVQDEIWNERKTFISLAGEALKHLARGKLR